MRCRDVNGECICAYVSLRLFVQFICCWFVNTSVVSICGPTWWSTEMTTKKTQTLSLVTIFVRVVYFMYACVYELVSCNFCCAAINCCCFFFASFVRFLRINNNHWLSTGFPSKGRFTEIHFSPKQRKNITNLFCFVLKFAVFNYYFN